MKNWIITALMLAAILTGCANTEPAETEPPVEQLKLIVTEEDIGQLEDYPALRQLDLRGSTCYEAIERYCRSHPEVEVAYQVSLGSRWVEPDVQTLTLRDGEYELETLLTALHHLPSLTGLHLPDTGLNAQQLAALRQAAEGVEVEYTVQVCGQTVSSAEEELALPGLQSEEVEAAAAQLAMLPGLKTVDLMDEEGNCALSVEEVGMLQDALPDTLFRYSFTLFGKTVSTEDETVEFVNKRIGDKGEPELRQALKIMKGCTYLAMDNCGFSNDVMSQLREEYRGRTKVVWRIFFAKMGSCRTDRKIIRYVYNLSNSNCSQLRYCEDAEFIDFGHNELLSDCTWVANMTKLRAIILSGSLIDDLTPFENCESLEFLEIAYCGRVKDLTPLAKCKNLMMVNTSFTDVEDLSPLDELKLERLCSVSSKVPEEEQERFKELHPDCLTLFHGEQPYGYCWRYEEDGKTPVKYYALLKEVFNYPNASDTIW